MRIDDSIIIDYLSNLDSVNYQNHWLFYNIEPNQYLFEEPDKSKKIIVSKIYHQVIQVLNDFTPFNASIFKKLFPNYTELLEDLNILLIVGCPNPYDAMFRKYEGTEYIVFDLIRFSQYVEQGYPLEDLITQFITHEFTHQCIHQAYPYSIDMTYQEKLSYIIFNEGIAHLLAFKSSIDPIDWKSEPYNLHYENAKMKLTKALQETDRDHQLNLLNQADSGPYWDKFGAIVGKIYFGLNLEYLETLYQKGYKTIIVNILNA